MSTQTYSLDQLLQQVRTHWDLYWFTETSASHWNNFALTLENTRPQDSHRCMLQAVRLDPANHIIAFNVGRSFKRATPGDDWLEQAMVYFSRSLKLSPGYANAKQALKTALTEKMQVLEWDIDNSNQWLTLGGRYYNGHDGCVVDVYRARLCWDKALELAPASYAANYNYALLYQYGFGVEKSLETARTYYERASAAQASDAVAQKLKVVIKGIFKENNWAFCLYSNNEEAVAYTNKGVEYANQGDLQSANICYEVAKTLNPQQRAAHFNLAVNTFHGSGRTRCLTTAKTLFLQAIPLGDESWSSFSIAINALLSIELELGGQEASAQVYYALGHDYYWGNNALQNKVIARYAFEKALTLADTPEAAYSKGHALHKLGRIYEQGYGVTANASTAKNYHLRAEAYYKQAIASGERIDEVRFITVAEPGIRERAAREIPRYLSLNWYQVGCLLRDSEQCTDAFVCFHLHLQGSNTMHHNQAHIALGRLYQSGQGGFLDKEKAAVHYSAAVVQAPFVATFLRELLQEQVRSLGWDITDADRWHELGTRYYSNRDGCTEDFQRAKLCYEKALELSSTSYALNYHYALLYQYGFGVEKSLETARNHYEQACKADQRETVKEKLNTVIKEIVSESQPAFSQSSDSRKAAYFCNKGVEYSNRGDFYSANIAYEIARGYQPQQYAANFNLAYNFRYGRGCEQSNEIALAFYIRVLANSTGQETSYSSARRALDELRHELNPPEPQTPVVEPQGAQAQPEDNGDEDDAQDRLDPEHPPFGNNIFGFFNRAVEVSENIRATLSEQVANAFPGAF